jgi:hypothetical protein
VQQQARGRISQLASACHRCRRQSPGVHPTARSRPHLLRRVLLQQVSVQSYNLLLTLSRLAEHSGGVLCLENGQAGDICQQVTCGRLRCCRCYCCCCRCRCHQANALSMRRGIEQLW